MKIVSINIRGLGGEVKRKYLRELVSKEDPGLLLVQETKLTKLDDSKCYSLWAVMILVGSIEGRIRKEEVS